MRRGGKGPVINTASFVAVMGPATSQISRAAAKGGAVALALARRAVRQGAIRVNALCPA
jgi:short-subunit dehydrogenase